jgi:hypothetical protein
MEIKGYKVTKTLAVYSINDIDECYTELKCKEVFNVEAFNYDNIRISFIKDGKLVEGFISYSQLKYATREVK